MGLVFMVGATGIIHFVHPDGRKETAVESQSGQLEFVEICDRIAGLQFDHQLFPLLSGNVHHGQTRIGNALLPDDGGFLHRQFHIDQYLFAERKGEADPDHCPAVVYFRLGLSGTG